MKIEFLHIHPQLEKELNVPDDLCIVSKDDLDKIMVFLIRNPIIFQAIIGADEFARQWNANSNEKQP
jgi:hypothetical protein